MDFDNAESVFRMKPAAVIEGLARQLVEQQAALAKIRATVAELPPDDPRTTEFRAKVDQVERDWIVKGVPNLAASFRLALEVLDTYGPEGIDEKDAVDAAIWNNKFFVYRDEFTPK